MNIRLSGRARAFTQLVTLVCCVLTMSLGVQITPVSAQTVHVDDGVTSVDTCGPVPAGYKRCFAQKVIPAQTPGSASPAARANIISGYGPSDLTSAYNITSGGDGTKTIAIVDAFGYPHAEADLAVYRANYGLPPCTTANGCFHKYNQTGQESNYPSQDPAGDNGWAQETALDLDMVSAICPNCKIILVESNTNDGASLAAAVNVAAGFGVHAISNSYGGEEGGNDPDAASYNHPGIAIVASAGDDGYEVNSPAAYPTVIAVGGTSLTTSATPRGWTETVWGNNHSRGFGTGDGTGSGCSRFFAKPAWQKDTGCAKRMVADVSAVANPSTGVAVYAPDTGLSTSSWQVYGGTSVASPIIAALYGVNGRPVNNYAKDLYDSAALLNDVATGANGTCPTAYFCNGAVGYDGPTGLGTPNGVNAFGLPNVPTLGEWAMILFGGLVAGGGVFALRRSRPSKSLV